jgi:peroxidase
MTTSKYFLCFLLLCFLLSLNANSQGLKVGFYDKKCPRAEYIVKQVISSVMDTTPSLAGPLLRMHFHDCFVRGCEGSVLLNSSTKQAEKDAPPNLSLRGYEVIDRVKTALEKACPGIVSCADILALVARDVTVESSGRSWNVETGRRDGNVSSLNEALTNLVPPTANISFQKTAFRNLGLSVKDLVVLAGGHTIGTSHCSSFNKRIYNFTGNGDSFTDPTLDTNYLRALRTKCKKGDTTTLVEMDPGSARTFDENYFTIVTKRRGLFQSDAALLDDPVTKAYVLKSTTYKSTFLYDFGVSMVNMGRIGVLTGKQGEVRKVCSKIN